MPNANDQPTDIRTSAERGRTVRTHLLQAASELIAEVGWNAVTTRRLADRAGIRPGLVHYHFDSLQSLLRQAAMSTINRILDDTGAQLSEGSDVADGTDALFSLLDVFDGSDPTSLLVIEAYLAATRDPQLKEQLSEEIGRFRYTLASALFRAGNPAPEAASLVILAALDGLTLQKGLDPGLTTEDAISLLRRIAHADQQGTHL